MKTRSIHNASSYYNTARVESLNVPTRLSFELCTQSVIEVFVD